MSSPDDDAEIHEPENSTVDDWHGQNVARDQEVADRAIAEQGSVEGAEAQFEREADGKERYEAGHDRPDDVDAPGDAVGRSAD